LTGGSLDVLAGYAKRFGSPAYIYDLAEVRASHALLRAALPESVEVAYSLKANPHPALVRTLGELGCALEVSSAGELAVAAPTGRPLIFTGPGKSDLDLEAAIRAECVLSLESPAELPRVREIAGRLGVDAGRVQVILRINPDFGFESSGISMAGKTQFGFSAADSRAWRLELARTTVKAVGYHIYGGSNLPGVDGLVKYFRAAAECIATVNRIVGLDIELLDLGGGFPAPYASPGTSIELNGLREALEALLGSGNSRPRVVVESGRYLSATSGTLVATVRDIKSAADGTRFVVLDAGVNHLGGMSALRRLPPVVAVPETSASDGSPDRAARLVGPLCTPLDLLNPRAMLPEGLATGDLVAIPNVGAYGLTASLLGFLSRDLPCEIVVDSGRFIEATRLALVRAACEES
jgi:diaminopimelate decarboxylase